MKPTIQDVARIAGVSKTTVSRVLNNSSLVQEDTRHKVQRVVNNLGYELNPLARSLRSQKGHLLGIIISDLGNPFYNDVIRGADQAARERGYDLLLYHSDGEPEREHKCILMLREKGCAAALLLVAEFQSEHARAARMSKIPIVLASGYDMNSRVACIGIDNVKAAKDMTNYLLSLGHSRIGVIRGPSKDIMASENRMIGIREALAIRGLSLDPILIEEGSFSMNAGFSAMSRLLTNSNRPTAVIAFNDEIAAGALQAANLRGLKVPRDISITGFDDLPVASVTAPDITTVAQPRYDLGYQGANIALDMCEQPGADVVRIDLPYRIMKRGSTSESFPAGEGRERRREPRAV